MELNFNKLVFAAGGRKFSCFGNHAYTLKSPTALFPSRITTQFLRKFLIGVAETVTHQCSWHLVSMRAMVRMNVERCFACFCPKNVLVTILGTIYLI